MTSKRWTAAGVGVGVLLTGAAVLLMRNRDEALMPAAQAQAPLPAVAVQTTRPERRNVSRLIALPGDIHPMEEATLYAKVPGYLQRIPVDKGDRVKAGELLAVIRAPELADEREQAQQAYQSALEAAQGSRAAQAQAGAESRRAQAAAEKAQADYAQAPATVEKMKALFRQAQGALHQAQEQKNQAEAALEESKAQVRKAQADLEAAQAEQHLADLTYARYQGIYEKNPLLVARQDVDAVESRAQAAHGRTEAAQSQLEAAQRHVQVVQAQVNAAASQIEQAQAQVSAAQEQIGIAQAQQTALKKQVEMAAGDVVAGKRRQEVAGAKARETLYQAQAGRSAFGKLASIADYTRLHAPFDGVIVRRYVDPGAFIQNASNGQNAEPIVTVADLSRVRLYVNTPEAEARFVRIGTPVTITATGLPDVTFAGRVARTTASLDLKTRTLLTEVDLPNGDGKLLPGAYATAKLALETHPNVLSVPSAAVVVEKTGKSVFVVENGKAKRIPVTTGFDDGAYTEITDGLHGGEQVIVTGRDALTPNAPVKATPWTPPVK